MKNLVISFLLGISLMGCTRVEPGFEGIRVNLVGTNRGVDDITIATGRVWYNPITEDVYQFPTHFVGYIWTAGKVDGSKENESISFSTGDKIRMAVDVEARLRFKTGRTPYIFVEHRKTADEIVKGYIRGKIRDAFVRCAGRVDSMDILGGGGVVTLQDCAKDWLNEDLKENYEFDVIAVVNAPMVDPAIENMIKETVAASQEAARAQQQVAVREAEARQAVATAEGRARSVLLEAEAQAEANRIINSSLTSNLVQWEAVKKWNGVQPQVVGNGSGVILDLSKR